MNLDLRGNIAVITGAGSGIGAACASLFYDAGAELILVDKKFENNQSNLKKYADKSFTLDITSEDDVKNLLERATEKYGRIDHLINSAGIYREKPLVNLELSDWNEMLNVNLIGTFLFCKHSIPLLKKSSSGSIVNIASVAGQIGGFVAGADYSASKAGVLCMTKSLTNQVKDYKIRVNTISPGPIESPMTENWPPQRKIEFPKNIPLGRLGKPKEVANVALFLCSNMASYVNGATINVNGGLYMSN
ncbi:MAG: beta-ketoacyl-ACP reductase [Candidatus Marinimicrobia bacterium]|nr:beta-ketoacyl-ACP reductase [Candidatus Neomarinimicrobiota bacterium]|tara:strand:+ start:35422 stop:36162 length:741 start_codon:yes stop_codon:yes gene_type:complete